MKKETIHIACNIDDAYVKYCIVMLTSLFENNRDESFRIHIIAGKLSGEARNLITSYIENKYHQSIRFYIVGTELVKNYPQYEEGSHISLAAYYRIFLGEVLPQELTKVIYLDCDLIVNGSISDLWESDITNYAIGCIEDMWSNKEDNYRRLNYSPSDSYFNSGVLLVNLNYWRESKLAEKAVSYITSNGNKLLFYDQDVLNALLHGKKEFLPFRYNVQDGFLRRKRRIRPASIPLLDEELKHPVVIHYTGSKKPWQYKSQHPYKNLYFRYLDMTEWKGERPHAPLSYRAKQAIDKLLYALRLAKPKYRKYPRL